MLISQIGPALPTNLTNLMLLPNFHSDDILLVHVRLNQVVFTDFWHHLLLVLLMQDDQAHWKNTWVKCLLNNCVCFPYKVPPSPFTAAKAAPTMELSFEMVQTEDCDPTPRTPEETSELFSRLADALIKQIEVHCTILLSSTLLSWFMFCVVELFSPRKRYIYVVQVIKHG